MTVKALPTPPPGRQGWPWTVESASESDARGNWPGITVVTPSLNQGRFIEETLRSVLLQNYPHLEYIVMDGGSTDKTLGILKKYEAWISCWISEPDHGQAAAINKGFARATGQIVAFLNSDDYYPPGALAAVARTFVKQPDLKWLCGSCAYVDEGGKEISIQKPRIPQSPGEWILRPLGRVDYTFPQPAVFLRNDFRREVGSFEEDYRYCFDHDYWIRALLTGHPPLALNHVLANFRVHSGSKTGSLTSAFQEEDMAIANRYWDHLRPREQKQVVRFQNLLQTMAVVSDCATLVQKEGMKSARRELLWRVLQKPSLLTYRAVWGAFRRWYPIHPQPPRS